MSTLNLGVEGCVLKPWSRCPSPFRGTGLSRWLEECACLWQNARSVQEERAQQIRRLQVPTKYLIQKILTSGYENHKETGCRESRFFARDQNVPHRRISKRKFHREK